jgi:hypothetical protein
MKKIFFTIAFGITASIGANAQINLIGASSNLLTSNIDLIQWEALDSLSVTTTSTILDGYVFGTSSFDAFNSDYYIGGISGETFGLYSFNSVTGDEAIETGSLYTGVAEFDMSTGKMYNLIMETEEYISIYEFDIETNTDSLIGIIYEPGVIAIVADAIGFDSNNGIIYYVGFSGEADLALYAIPVREDEFSFTKTILTTTDPVNSITSVNFDNVNEKLYALNDTYNEFFDFTGRNVVEIDMTAGDVITRGELVEFPIYVGGSSSFDQETGTFLLVGIDTSDQLKMIAFDTYADTYITGYVPGTVSEIVCDNSRFAKNAYGTAGIEQASTVNFTIYPNPVSEILTIDNFSEGPLKVQIYSTLGDLVYAEDFAVSSKLELNLTSLSPGLYTVNLIGANLTATEKILVR